MRGRSDYSFGKPSGQGFGNDCSVGAEIYHFVDVLVVSFLLMPLSFLCYYSWIAAGESGCEGRIVFVQEEW